MADKGTAAYKISGDALNALHQVDVATKEEFSQNKAKLQASSARTSEVLTGALLDTYSETVEVFINILSDFGTRVEKLGELTASALGATAAVTANAGRNLGAAIESLNQVKANSGVAKKYS